MVYGDFFVLLVFGGGGTLDCAPLARGFFFWDIRHALVEIGIDIQRARDLIRGTPPLPGAGTSHIRELTFDREGRPPADPCPLRPAPALSGRECWWLSVRSSVFSKEVLYFRHTSPL